MEVTNKTGLHPAIVEAVRNDPYDGGCTDFSATTLCKPPQMVALEREHAHEIEEDVTDMLWALMGQAMHSIIERADGDEETLTEKRFFSVINGARISGQVDSHSMRDGVLSDFKLCSVWVGVFGIRDEWKQQLNILAQLLRNNGYPVNGLQVVTLYRDYSLTESRRRHDYPQEQMQVHPVEMWSESLCQAWITQRVAMMQLAVEDGKYEPCTDEEIWLRDAKLAVMKTGRKTAIKLYNPNQEDEAYRHASETPGGWVEHRRGTAVRCADYCRCAPFCQQYAKFKENAE